jgi:hypothetical protein
MSKSYEIIDPSLYTNVIKTTNQSSLIDENKSLKKINAIIILSAVLVLGVSFIYYQNRVSDDKHER